MPTVNGPDEITTLEGGNDKVFYSNNTGEITELALGAADTVLTSAGATSAPTWEAAAGGSEITLNSSAAIALGKFVVLETAGTVKEVSSTTTLSTSFGSKVTSGGPTSVVEKQHPSVIWDSTRGVFWCSVADSSGVIQIYIMEVTSAGVVTLNSVSTISGTGTGTYGLQSMTHDTTNDKLVVMYEASTGYFDVQSGTLSGTGSSSTVSAWSGAVNVSSSFYRWVGVPVSSVYVAATDRSYFIFTNYNQYCCANVIDTSGASPVIANSGDYVNPWTNNQYYGYDCALAANGQIAIVGAGNGGFAGMTAYNITPSASGWTLQDTGTGGTQIMAGIAGVGTTQGVAVVYDASETKMVAYQVGNQAQTELATFVIPTTGDMTNVSTTLALDSSNTFTYVQRVRPPLGYDTTNNVVIAGYKTTASSPFVVFERIDTSGTNPVKAGSPVTSTLSESNWSQFGGVAYSPTYNWLCWSGCWGATSGGFSVSTASISTNNTAQIGVAQNAATGAGQAVTIKTLGALDETQTGMTVGDIYIDKDGAPTATSTGLNIQVGRAIAADKLLITETGSGTV
tara:strand:- start:1143 stop:2843 length:1701 start_codon:yes stop_codon:yes gene_type:complete